MTTRHAFVRKAGRITSLGLSMLMAKGVLAPSATVAMENAPRTDLKTTDLKTTPSARATGPASPTASVPSANPSTPTVASPARSSAANAPIGKLAQAAPASPEAPPPVAIPAPPPGAPPVMGVPPAPEAPPPMPPEVLAPPAPPPVESPATSTPMEGYDPSELEVVKVTVDRREQNIQSYAGSASAYSQEDLSRVGVKSVRDLSQVNPALEIGTQDGNTEIFIRGIGSTNNTELGDPSAATHVDGIYMPRPRGVGSMFFDIERVELNRGPQGTVRGRNATAGSLNIITAKPKLGEFAADASLQLGNYAQRLSQAMVNIPIGDTLALRFAAFGEVHDPYFKNGGPISTNMASESADALAYRMSAKWAPAPILTVNVGHDYTLEKGTAYTGSNFDGAFRAGLLPNEVPDPRSVVYRGPQPSQNMKHWGVHADVLVDLGPITLNYLGGYRNLTFRQVTGGNLGVAYPGLDINDASLDNWSSSWWYSASQSQVHELRIATPDTSHFRGAIGGFLFHERQQVTLLNTADNSNTFGGVEFNMPDVKGDSQAGYFDGVLDIFKWLRGTGGIRFTHETKERTGLGAVWNIDGANPMGQNFRYGTEGFQPKFGGRTLYPTVANPLDPTAVFLDGVARFGARDTVDNFLTANGGGTVRANSITPQSGKYSGNFLDFRLGTDLDLTPTSLAYLTFSTGHHSGGFNDNVNYTDATTGMLFSVAPTYKPETLYAFELGSKNEFLDRKLKVNAAGFYYLYRDQQFQIIQQTGPQPADPTQPPPASAVRVNAGKSHILGLEFETSYRLPFGLSAGLSGLLMDARLDEGRLFDNRVAFGPTNSPDDKVNVANKHLPRSPTVTLNYSLAQNIQTPVGWFDWIASAQTRSQYFMTVFNGNGTDSQGRVNPTLSDVVPTYTRIDLGAGYTRPNGKVRLSLFANNVNNVAYMTTFITQPGLNLRFFNSPRQVGVRINLYW